MGIVPAGEGLVLAGPERLDMLGIVLDLDRSLLAVEVEHHTAEEESHRQERRPLLEVLKLLRASVSVSRVLAG